MKIIKIGAMWCPGCLVMKKVWKEIISKYPELLIEEYDYDMDADLISKYNPGKILPIVIFLDTDNHEIGRLIGEKTYDEIISKILEYSDL